MGIKCGIVGLPNVGKSTLFNALTAAEIPAENYPFCTIDPNVGVVTVPDPKLDAIAAIVKPEKVVPTVVEFVDIAGLVEGASQGQGLGNQFLAHIRETHAIAHLVRCFKNDDVIHVAGAIDPPGRRDQRKSEHRPRLPDPLGGQRELRSHPARLPLVAGRSDRPVDPHRRRPPLRRVGRPADAEAHWRGATRRNNLPGSGVAG